MIRSAYARPLDSNWPGLLSPFRKAMGPPQMVPTRCWPSSAAPAIWG